RTAVPRQERRLGPADRPGAPGRAALAGAGDPVESPAIRLASTLGDAAGDAELLRRDGGRPGPATEVPAGVARHRGDADPRPGGCEGPAAEEPVHQRHTDRRPGAPGQPALDGVLVRLHSGAGPEPAAKDAVDEREPKPLHAGEGHIAAARVAVGGPGRLPDLG